MKLRKFVPIRLRQNIATSMESSSKGIDAMSQTSTSSFTFTKSKLRTLTFLFFWKCFANAASPQPKSATLKRLDFADVESRLMNISTGLVGQDWTWWRKPSWYYLSTLDLRKTHVVEKSRLFGKKRECVCWGTSIQLFVYVSKLGPR